ncbi:Catenin-beta-like protein [Crepidotus variabilis]|uniref:Catenin-beta-like protein n=1 Tax=Crepidotus variabilis TaxID=179855 RepID=A0A9P6ERW7_9AGAR|nr:Catenin-beta-like protein [Crepidotus variabilis]
MDIDELFKVPKLPRGANKRKLPDNPTPDMLKKMKLEAAANAPSSSSPSPPPPPPPSRKATVEDEEDDEMDGTFAPGGDADYFAEEDGEGRFFGGGLTSEQKDILNIFEKSGGEGVDETDELSITRIRRLLLSFERAVNKNQDQRSKYPNDPSKFIDSEADLDGAIKALLPLSQAPTLSYPEIVRSGVITLLVGLLTHENVDIAIDVVELIFELTDEDADLDQDAEDDERVEEAVTTLIESLVENSVLNLLVDNLSRLNEQEESDRQGVFHILGIFENFVGLNPELATSLVSGTTILEWLLKRLQAKKHDENRSYAAELLSVLLQDSVEIKIAFSKHDGVETILKALSQYRKRDPVDADETEFMENVFDALCSALSEASVKKLFLEAEGPDLMILMVKEKLESKSRSIKVLDYAMSGPDGAPICEAFVEALGLKTIFTAFMGKTSKKSKTNTTTTAPEDVAHSLGIISSLFSNLPSDSPSRIRLLTKFVEGEYEKIDKLIEIRESARKRLKATDSQIETDRKDIIEEDGEDGITADIEDAFYLQRLDGGLFTLQTVDFILAWVIMEDDGIRTHALRMLDRNNQSQKDIVETLKVYEDHADDNIKEDSLSQKEILRGLISALDTSQS